MSDTIEITKSSGELLIDEACWELRDDGRLVRGRIVPFKERALVVDKGERFVEQFLPGCLTRLCQLVSKRGNAGFISLNLDHDESFDRLIGYAATIEQHDDGGWADFKLYRSPDLDKIRSMLEESHGGLSVSFTDVVPPLVIDGVRSRVQVGIHHVAATPFPTYRGAAITAMRDVDSTQLDEIDDRPALREWQQYLDELTPTKR